MSLPEPRRLPGVDALRAIATLLVFWTHYAETFVRFPSIAEKGHLLADIATTLDLGRIGVICFFLISGFVVPSGLKQGRPHAVGVFVIRRFFRLFPAYWLSLLLGIIIYATLFSTHFSTATILANIAMVQTFILQPHVWGLYWTLEVELAFYVLCVLMFSFGKLRQTGALLIACFGLTFLYGVSQLLTLNSPDLSPQKALSYMPLMLAIMFLGTLYRKAFDEGARGKDLGPAVLGTLICFSVPLLIMAAAAVGKPMLSGPYRFGFSHLLGLAVFLVGLRFLKRPPKVLVWIGTVSYSVYLFHSVILWIVLYYFSRPSSAWAMGGHVSIYMVLGLAATLLLSAVVYYGIENPAIKLGHRLSKRLQSH